MNVKQKTLAALLVLGIGMSGCNTNDNNLIPQIVNKKTDENKTEGNRTVPTPPGENNESNVTDPNPPDEVIIPVPPKQMFKGGGLVKVLKDIGDQHSKHESNITIVQIKEVTKTGVNDNYVNIYRSYIESNDTTFSSPATVAQVQSMIDEVNALNLPEHAIVDRSFFTKTNGAFEHRFVYLAVESNTTGRTWLNNNLGASYADMNSSDYNPSQQARTSTDHLAYGSLFQWGRKADGHELINWTDGTHGTGKYGTTTSKANDPSDSLYIVEANAQHDWRVNRDDTLWASESSANNVCPVGYRLPLNPNEANDAKNEWYQETNTWSTKNMVGALTSNLKLVRAGIRDGTNGTVSGNNGLGGYWTGSAYGVNAHTMDFNSDKVRTNNVIFNYRADGNYVRCIKEQTPAERVATILKVIGNEHRNHKSTVTVAQLKAITPALENINNNYETIYRSYIEGDTHFSSSATRDEVQHMIDEINALNLPTNAVIDRNFYKKTNGKFEHKFVYLPLTNTTTGKTWLNNNLGAEYANVNSSSYNPTQQAKGKYDHLAYGSLFQWGRKADGHELINWSISTNMKGKYGRTTTKADNPSNALFITGSDDYLNSNWRVNKDDTLWASEASENNVCPVGYRLPLNPNGTDDGANEFYQEAKSWTRNIQGAFSSFLKLSAPGLRNYNASVMWSDVGYGNYWTGSVNSNEKAINLVFEWGGLWASQSLYSRAHGLSVRCVKDQLLSEEIDSILTEIGNENHKHKSIITVNQLKKIIPKLNNIDEANEKWYQNYIEGTDIHFSSPATREEIQHMIDEVNGFSLPNNAILDRSFHKKTNGKFEHRFVYLSVINPITGRKWLNNNLGAEYANATDPNGNYKPEQQATASNDYKAYGSLFQWGRKADGHELINWTDATHGTGKYNVTSTKADTPSNSLFIKSSKDWRGTQDDTLWANKSSSNNVCPAGYRLPMNPNNASDGENEWYREIQTFATKDISGAFGSVLKLTMPGFRDPSSGRVRDEVTDARYWFGSSNGKAAHSLDIESSVLDHTANTHSTRANGFSVRCIKNQTFLEKAPNTLLEIANEHNRHNSVLTVAQLKAVIPVLNNIDEANEKWYQSYIEGTDTHFSTPATIDEVQSMIDEVNGFRLPNNAILDRNFYKKTNGKFEHRFVYLPITNDTTGKTWLNNNLGAEYANLNSNHYELSKQATASDDYLAYGSLFQWGRKADGHELINWTNGSTGRGKYNTTIRKSDTPSNSLFITGSKNWRVHQNDTLWANESSVNNICPVGYRLPHNLNGSNSANEFYQEIQTWTSQNSSGALESSLKLPIPGYRNYSDGRVYAEGRFGYYWSGSVNGSNARNMYFYSGDMNFNDDNTISHGYSVRCIKN